MELWVLVMREWSYGLMSYGGMSYEVMGYEELELWVIELVG